ncbi:MAG: hypothetical protein RLZ83_1024, partial [Pseudomonadota bacterium]
PDLLADYADALAMTQGGKLAGEPERLVQQALQAEPAHVKALALAGSAALERGDARAAVEIWTCARQAAPADSPFVAGLDASLAEARAQAGMPAVPTAAPGASAAADAAAVSLSVGGSSGQSRRRQRAATGCERRSAARSRCSCARSSSPVSDPRSTPATCARCTPTTAGRCRRMPTHSRSSGWHLAP